MPWPALPPAADWAETRETLHRWLQVAGKVRLAHAPLVNHWWNVPLYVTPRGLTTGLVPHAATPFEVRFDFQGHEVVLDATGRDRQSLALPGTSVAGLTRWLLGALAEAGAPTKIWTTPVEIPGPVETLDQDERSAYDAGAVAAYHGALVQADRVLGEFRSRFLDKCSPVHLFWGAFDLAVTRFSGETAPPHPGGAPHLADRAVREAYSHEVSSAGFWPGAEVGGAAFYSYTYPEPDGFAQAVVTPAAARYDVDLGEWVLPYDAVRQSDDPDATLLGFLETTYAAAADRAGWDRPRLERPAGRARPSGRRSVGPDRAAGGPRRARRSPVAGRTAAGPRRRRLTPNRGRGGAGDDAVSSPKNQGALGRAPSGPG